MKIKEAIGVILTLGAIVGLVICAIAAIMFHIQNPDMTELRRLIEYPAPSIWAIICVIAGKVGLELIRS